MVKFVFSLFFSLHWLAISAQKYHSSILPGAYQLSQYISLIKNKKVALFANQTSLVNQTHLLDTLLKKGVQVTKIFSPEHGFRGKQDAGARVDNAIDEATGIPIVSLYGKKKEPSAEDWQQVDVLIFDIQDVGVRFYTYISSLENILKSAINFDKPVILLDRPNPNGFYVDGPVLEPAFKSFVGMQPVPVVYGMTIGEYAKMLLGEEMLPWKYIRKQTNKITLSSVLGFEEKRQNFKLTVIPCKNYTHRSHYHLPVPPSPNLLDMASVYWYPSICFFEGTVLSEGRGTEHPFCIFGHPKLSDSLFAFTPQSKIGAKEPKHKNTPCYGWNVYQPAIANVLEQTNKQLQIGLITKAYAAFPQKDSFFLVPKTKLPEEYFFNKLAGNATLMQQIQQLVSVDDIRKSWQTSLAAFKKIRKKYLLYPDFE